MLAPFAAGFRRALAILRKVPGITHGAATAVTALASFAARFYRPGPVVSEIAGTTLATDMTGPRRLFAIQGKIATIGDRLG